LQVDAPLLKEELRISASELGILLSAFFWTYTAMQFVSGWIVDSFDVNRVIVAGFLLWSLATAATGLVRGFTMLLAMRLILGTGESVMSPAYSKILSFHLPEHHRGFANGVLQAAVRSENLAALLSYVFDWLTGLIFLLLEKRPYVRFYAVQSTVVPGPAHSCEPSSLRYSALQKSGL
jgi:MFS family permease